jgi:asparagine synthase (glutamine-hydrolysing)
MCGIAGVFNPHPEETVPETLLASMVDALAHRGPDDRGSLLLGSVALGARRLSIVDLAGGHQPMSSTDGQVHLVQNGEIYNHLALRDQLEARGHRFRTRCDTEVILHGYREWGARGIAERLNGIFAFAIWDATRRVGYLGRDRVGVKPLYYVHRGGRLAFSSELRALSHCGLLRPQIDQHALSGYLIYQFTPDERTLLAGALKLPPGHLLAWRAGGAVLEKYWDFPADGAIAEGGLAQQATEVRELLHDAVRSQLMSDVPVGCFLSGGLDSSSVASFMARSSSAPLRTYSISFPDYSSYDESEHFERLAAELGAAHTTIRFSEQEVLHNLANFAWAADEPVADPAMLPTYLLAQTAARDVKVVLTGEGADEIFAGYPYYRALVDRRPNGDGHDALASLNLIDAMARRTGTLFPAPRTDQASPTSGFPYSLDAAFVWQLLAPDRRGDPSWLGGLAERIEARAVGHLGRLSRLQTAQVVDCKVWLANDLMPKLDKMTMAHSLEGRVPFLDHRLVEFAFRLPASAKIGADEGKVVLREAMRGVLPPRLIRRAKQGFNVPLQEWFRGRLRDWLRETLLGTDVDSLGFFDRRAVEALLVAHTELGVNVARPLWQILCVALWAQELFSRMAGQVRSGECAESELRSVAPPQSNTANVCDIVIPVYEGVGYVRDLLRSIERHTNPGTYRLLVVDDSAQPGTHKALRALVRGRPWLNLYRNEENLGFVASCNRGIELGAADGSPYVCFLNSDTLVSEGWLSRMIAAAESDERVAVVNPTSNKAVNLSVPLPPGYDFIRMGRKLGERTSPRYPDVTTAVGFCMLVKRRYLEELGAFDPVYGHGYCEESDLCMRYTEAGLRVVVADDAFVYHRGCGSFGTWQKRYEENRKIFDRRWGEEYARDYRRFLSRNPLQPLRDSLLRHTVAKNDGATAVRALDDEVARQRRMRVARAEMVLGRNGNGRWWSSDVHRVSATISARPRTPRNAEQRELRYPTRAYLDGIPPAPEGSGPTVTFLVGSMGVCGGMISIVQLAREFLLRGLAVNVVTLSEELDPEVLNLPLQPLVYPDRETLVRLFPPSDVVVATYWTTAHDYVPALKARYDFLSVYFVQDYEAYFYPDSDGEKRRQIFATYELADHRIVKSKWLAGLIEQRHGTRCEIVPLGLDLGIFRTEGRRLQRGAPFRVVSVARPYERRRGFAEVSQAFRQIHRRRRDVELVFFGTPEEEMPVGLDFPYVNLGAIKDQNRVAELLRSCDVLIDSSLFQAFGRPGLEAMACGTACVLTGEGGVAEYARDGENCLLAPPRDGEAIAEATLRLLQDEALRKRLSVGGVATAGRFSHVQESERHLDLYRGWLRARGGEA